MTRHWTWNVGLALGISSTIHCGPWGESSSTVAENAPVQRYSSFGDLVPLAHDAWMRFQRAPGYENVKVAFTRYSFDNAKPPSRGSRSSRAWRG